MEKNLILSKAKNILPWLKEIRRDFHMYPELGMEEFRTSKKICEYLDEMKITYKSKIANTGVLGYIDIPGATKTVALRADMDALPLQERNDVPYKSKIDSKMHACGHDVHMAVQLGAAKILTEFKKDLKCNVKLLFQPAEENVGGAVPMIKEGVLKNPDVDAIFGLHVSSQYESGEISFKYGVAQASSDCIEIVITGKSAHGAHPDVGIDAILIAGHVITAIQSIVSRTVRGTDSLVITLGTINGGCKENIIADRVVMSGTMRSTDSEVRKKAIEQLQSIVCDLSKSFGGNGEVTITQDYCSLINDNEMMKFVDSNAIELVGKENVTPYKMPSMGVEDFAFYLRKVPGAFFRIGICNEGKGITMPAHNNYFDVDEDAMVLGVAMQVMNVLKFTDL